MTDLANLQESFQAYLLQADDMISHQLNGSETSSIEQRLNVYREGYYLRLIASLSQTFPMLSTLLSNKKFDRIARRYIDVFPSSFFSIRHFGHQLAEFLRNHQRKKPYLAEMASFEWQIAESFDAADLPLLTIEDIAKIDPTLWPQMTFQMQPSVRFLALQWNTLEVWAALNNQQPTLPSTKITENDCMIWRKEYLVHFKVCTPTEMYVLGQIEQGSAFGEICTGLCGFMESKQVAVFAATLLKQLVHDECLSWKN